MFDSDVSSDTTDTRLIYFCYLFSLARNAGGRGCGDDFCFWNLQAVLGSQAWYEALKEFTGDDPCSQTVEQN